MSKIRVSITDKSGVQYELSDEEIYELRSAVGIAKGEGMLDDNRSGRIVQLLPAPYIAFGHEKEEDIL